MGLRIHNKEAMIVPFRDTLNDSEELAWVYYSGMKELYTPSLVGILKNVGYIIKDYRAKAKMIPIDFQEIF